MKEYQFEYTKILETLIVVILTIATFIVTAIAGIYLKLNLILILILSVGFAFLVFRMLKGKAVCTCTAKLGDTSVSFEFENGTKIINFIDLTSYKSYYGKNGPILYLKNNIENFKIFANNNFCKTDNFKSFCEDTIIQLDRYKDKYNSTLIHDGSIYTTKGMLYFLIATTSVYLFSLFIATNTLRVTIGFFGGLFLLTTWIRYFIENNKLRDQNGG